MMAQLGKLNIAQRQHEDAVLLPPGAQSPSDKLTFGLDAHNVGSDLNYARRLFPAVETFEFESGRLMQLVEQARNSPAVEQCVGGAGVIGPQPAGEFLHFFLKSLLCRRAPLALMNVRVRIASLIEFPLQIG